MDLIDWSAITRNFQDLRRSVGHASTSRNTENLNEPPLKRPRVEPHNNTSICLDKFPPLDPEFDKLTDPARFLIDAAQTKVFYGAMVSLSRFSDSLLLYPTRNDLIIKACNLTRTAAGLFTFCLEFFGGVHTFDFPKEKPCCRVFTKPFLTVLKNAESNKHLDNVIIDMDPCSETLVVRVTLRHGIKKFYRLPLSEVLANSIPNVVQRDSSHNVVVLLARQLSEALDIAGKDANDIGFWGTNDDIIFHSIFQPAYSLNTKWRKGAMRVSDCVNISIRKMVNFSFAVKDIRALAKFADKYNSTISLYFKTAKSALFAVIDIPGLCEATFTVSTGVINDEDTSNTIKQMIPGINTDINPATQQSRRNRSIANSQVRAIATSTSQFEPRDIGQSDPLIKEFVNKLPESYWRQALVIRSVEIVEFD